jgi:peptide/nickel transport system substrate-binding protein
MKKIACMIMVLLCVFCVNAFAELQGPVEYPEGKMMPGGKEIKLFNLDEILVYKKLPKYSQPEWMDKLVADGVIPPVEQRLPEEPQVILTSFMSSGPGVYGGILRAFSACPTEGWNLYAGQTQGWFGINAIYSEELVQSGPTFLRKDKAEPLPNLAKSWEWQEDGKVLIMHLVKGVKWSDGAPFDAEDVMFTWNDMILDPNVRSWTSRSSWQIDGKDITLEALDPYTLKWTFPVSYPVSMLFNMDFLDFSIAPSHWLKPKHPKYNKDMDYVSFENCMPPTDLPVPSMGPWVATEYKVDEVMVMRRNPYYWKVDDTGRQLPYLDEVIFQKGSSGVGRTMGTMAGSLDHDNVENPEVFVEVMKKAQDPNSPFVLSWGQELLSFELELNLSANLGVKTDRDKELRNLFRDLRFRRALNHAIDRDGLGQSVVKGPFLRAFPGGIYPGSIYFDRKSVVYYPYAPESAKALLAEIGFKDTDGDKILNWTTGPLKGENLVIQCIAHEDQAAAVMMGEAMVPMLGDVGIQVNFRPVTSSTGNQLNQSGEWEMRVYRGEQEYAVPQTRYKDIAPITKERPWWHRAGAEPRELLPFENDLIRIVNQFAYEPDFAKQKALMSEYNKIFTENCYMIGLVIGRYGLMMSKRIQNVPVGTPPFLYQWDFNNFMAEQLWAKPEDQLTETMPNTIPIYKKK